MIYEIHGQSVTIRPEGETLMDLAGCLKTGRKAVSKAAARAAARKAVAQRFRDEQK